MCEREETETDAKTLPPEIAAAHKRAVELRTRCAHELADLKELRKTLQKAEKYLDELLGDAEGGQGRMFTESGEPTAQAAQAANDAAVNVLSLVGVDDDDDDWREIDLDRLPGPGLTPGILKKLAENSTPITTLGELTDWINANGDFWHKKIRGIGKAAADRIADACEAFWKDRTLAEADAGESDSVSDGATELPDGSTASSPPSGDAGLPDAGETDDWEGK